MTKSKFLFRKGQTILFAGDSITDCKRQGEFTPYGHGYVKIVRDLIQARYPSHGLQLINKGISGNTVKDLYNRWEDDVLHHRPHWLSIKVGINDLHRVIVGREDQVPLDQYERYYRAILQETRKRLPSTRMILIDPFYISLDNRPNAHRRQVLELLSDYIQVVKGFAREFKTLHVQTHQAFQQQLKFMEPDDFCPEPIHPNPSGHTVIAHEFLKAVGW